MCIYTDLISTYNTNLLDKEDKLVQTTFDRISSENMNNTEGRVTLMKLIHNHYHPDPDRETIRSIYGPTSLTIYTTHVKTLCIFGHPLGESPQSGPKECVHIKKYLTDLFNTTDVFIDFYGVQDTHKYTQKDTQFTRTHYVDGVHGVHGVGVHGDNFFHKFMYTYNIINTYGIRGVKMVPKDIFPVLLSAKLHTFFADFVIKNVNDGNVNDSYMSTEIITWFNDQLALYLHYFRKPENMTKIQEIINTLNNDATFDTLNYVEQRSIMINISNIATHIISKIHGLMMDVYTLAHIFPKDPNKDEPNEPHNIIVYTRFPEHYSSFLKYVNYTGHTGQMEHMEHMERTERFVERMKRDEHMVMGTKCIDMTNVNLFRF